TLPIAIARPIKAVPINNRLIPVIERNIIPINKTTKDNAIVLSIPLRFEILGANGERIANAIKGKVVIIPAVALRSPISSRIHLTSAPTDLRGSLKVERAMVPPPGSRRCLLVVLSPRRLPARLRTFLVLSQSRGSLLDHYHLHRDIHH